ncbi:MAG TPA: hypothetical protein VKP30_25945 [Polyangiaceae bacterium]|nr:hypothetical protein [Polyangiaceae bacterium]
MTRMLAFLIAAVLIGCGSSHESNPENVDKSNSGSTETAQTATLSLAVERSEPTRASLVVNYSGRTDAQQSPRVAELVIEHSESLSLDSGEPGAAAVTARKQVVVQAKDATHTRVVVYSADNTNGLGSGSIVRLNFTRTSATATAKILTDRPIFAPKEAQQGLQVSEPLSI